MAYPTGVFFKPVGPSLGIQPIAETSATAQHPLGFTVRAKDLVYGEAWFVYLTGVASTVAGDLVTYDTTSATTRALTTSRGPVAISMSANTAGRFGWYLVDGSGPVRAAAATAAGQVYVTAAGQVSTSGTLIDGAKFVSALAVDHATVQVDSASIPEPSAGASGVTTMAAVGATPNANGASISSNTLTLQPASATLPGVMTAATYGRVANQFGPYLIKPDCFSNGAVSIATSTGTIWLQSLSVQTPVTVTGVSYCIGGTIGGSLRISLYGGTLTSGRWSGVTTWGVADGANLVTESGSVAQAGTINRTQNVAFTASAALNPGQYWVGMEFDGVAGTINRCPQFPVGGDCMRVMTHTYGAAPATLSATSENGNGHPVMFLMCSQTQLAFP